MSSVSGILNKTKTQKKKTTTTTTTTTTKKRRKEVRKKEEGRKEKNMVIMGTLCFPKPRKSGMRDTIILIFI